MSLPVPLSDTLCDREGSLSLIVSVPVRAPAALGAKTTEIAQLKCGTTVPQLLLCEKSPLTVTPDTTNAFIPRLVIVTTCAALEVPTTWPLNVRELAEKPAKPDVPEPPAPTPAPATNTCGEITASSFNVIVAITGAPFVGVKVS